MKKMMLLGFLMLAAVALAGESTYTLTSSTQATAPSGASQTGAIAIANTWKGVGVAIFDQRDGGAGDVELIQSQVRGRLSIMLRREIRRWRDERPTTTLEGLMKQSTVPSA